MKTPMAPKFTALKNKDEKSAFGKKKRAEEHSYTEHNWVVHRSVLLWDHTETLSMYCHSGM